MKICLSHGGITTYISNEPENEILVGTVRGVFSIQRGASEKWNASERGLGEYHIHALMIEPSTGMFFAGARKGSLHASEDSGKTWKLRDNGLTEKDIYSLNYVSHGKGKIRLYAGTEPAHLYQSDDFAKTWEELTALRSVPSIPDWTFPSPPHEAHVKCIAIEPNNPRIIYVCIEQGGLLRSDDAGLTWNEIHGFDTELPFEIPEGLAANDVHRLVVKDSDPKWLCTAGGVGMCRSRDAGKTWEHLTTPSMRIGYPDALVFHPYKQNLGFMAGARYGPLVWRDTHDADSAIARTRDGGNTWEILQNGLPEHIRGNVSAMTLHVWDKVSSCYVGTTDGQIFFSDNEGDRWSLIVDGLPAISKGRHYLTLHGPERSDGIQVTFKSVY
jgi:photosystem II stability/assembly factor-like uncharacterized protein